MDSLHRSRGFGWGSEHFHDHGQNARPEIVTSYQLDWPHRLRDWTHGRKAKIRILKKFNHSLVLVASQHEMRRVIQLELVTKTLLGSVLRQERQCYLGSTGQSVIG